MCNSHLKMNEFETKIFSFKNEKFKTQSDSVDDENAKYPEGNKITGRSTKGKQVGVFWGSTQFDLISKFVWFVFDKLPHFPFQNKSSLVRPNRHFLNQINIELIRFLELKANCLEL